MTLVSIIIPTYNRLWSLKEAVASCFGGQRAVQLIVVDDGSTDGTWDWLQAQRDLVAVRQENLGKCWAVNRAMTVATGEFVRFLDSDDLLEPGSTDRLVALAEQSGADICVSGYVTIDENGAQTGSREWTTCDDFIAQQLGECDSSHYSAYLFRREFIADIPHRPDFAFRDDRLFVLECALREPAVAVLPGVALRHREHGRHRLQNRSGLEQHVQHYQQFMLYRRILAQLAGTGRLTERRAAAAARILGPLAHWVAKYDVAAGRAISAYTRQLSPTSSYSGNAALVYRLLGFTAASRLFNAYRFFRYRG